MNLYNAGNTLYGLVGSRSRSERNDVCRMRTAPFYIHQSTKFTDWVETSAVGTKIAISALESSGAKGTVSPEEVAAVILRALVARAEKFLDAKQRIRDVVITVPAYFNETQKAALNDAAEIAGLRVLRLLTEPVMCTPIYQSISVWRKRGL